MDLSQKYTQYCKPELGKLLSTIRLDKSYHRAEGDRIYYYDTEGSEIEILDFLGGYGASLFGHNHPRLIGTAIENYQCRMPFNAQASCRSQAALLCEKLNGMMLERTGKSYVITLANTGTEAVEAALKHAEMQHVNKIKKIYEDVRNQIVFVKKKRLDRDLKISEEFYHTLHHKIGASPDKDLGNVLGAINDYNYKAFEKPPVFISVERSFHGKTTGSVKLTHNKLYKEPLKRVGIDVRFVSGSSIEEVEKIIEDSVITYYNLRININNELFLEEKKHYNVSALFIEPLQGEGGIHSIDKDFLKGCRSITSSNRIPLIFDEIQCGMGRTGSFLYSEQQGVAADYYLLSKSLGGGIAKIAALMIDSKMYQDEFSMIHSSTFAEDDHSSSIAAKALETLQVDRLYERCIERGNQLMEGLNEIKNRYPSVIKDVRGAGLMIGVEFSSQNGTGSRVFKMISDQSLLGYIISGYLLHEHRIRVAPTLSSNTTIRLEPSAYIEEEDCRRLICAFERLCEIIYKQNIYQLIKFVIGNESYNEYEHVVDYRKIPDRQDNGCCNDNIKKVAFLGHFIEAKHLVLWDNAFSGFSENELEELFEKLYRIVDPIISEECVINSITGDKVQLVFIGLFVNSKIISRHMKNSDIKVITDKVDEAVEMAKARNCQVIGFGGYTSIVTNNCMSIITDSAALTSGNSLTVATGIEAMLKAVEDAGINSDKACFAAIGAAGNIASVYSEILAESIPRIILIGNKGREKNLRKVAEKIYFNAFQELRAYRSKTDNASNTALKGIALAISNTWTVDKLLDGNERAEMIGSLLYEGLERELGGNVPIIVTSDLTYLRHANLILGASNSAEPVIFPDMLSKDITVICDIAVPADTHHSVSRECGNAIIIKGGLVKLPLNPSFSMGGMPLDKGESFACMAETVLMGLADIHKDYSCGAIDKMQVKKIMELARIHGFKLGNKKTVESY